MIVCLCHRISDRDIERAVQSGTRDFDQLQDETCIARNCACCEDCARDTFEAACGKVVRLHRIEEPALA
jgi:bacterioferritin-associated ferredoxin